ncbi:MAG: ABC-F family ATP-binding cassette domain-containing protein [Oscillospiraceae bacterium]|nr:ABC-F family ATP-binding cassette domain-containing protein [Oscillospiraceae bacterium]
MLITLISVSKTFLDKPILKNISLSVNDRDRIGLLGINGVGKSTLLNIISGGLSYDEGTISSKPGLRIGYLKQNEALNSSNTLKEEIEDALKEVFETRKAIQEITLKMANSPKDEYGSLSAEYDRLTNIYNAFDGHNAEIRINTVLNGMGFGSFDMNGRISLLSGGEKMRFAMCKILVQNPELLILDEPTNHLDFEMLSWLEQYLSSYKGAVIVVSHDRYFLDAVSSGICELENGELVRYKGGYSSFLKQKEERIKVLSREYEKQQRELEELRDYVRRNIAKSSSTNSVGSRVKALEKAELLAKPNPKPKDLIISFPFDIEPHKTVLECKDMSLTVGKGENAKTLFQNLNLEILKGEKVAFVGRNGIGKSSFLKAILKKLPYCGSVKWGGNVKISYFDQELSSLDLNATVIDSVHRKFPTKTEYEIRSMLARFLIEDEDVFKRVKEMSGANRAKIVFCIISFERSNALVLDEPTNHLDYKAKEALELALRNYEGTIIAVSHDRYLLQSVPNKIIEMTSDGAVVYNGNYDYYKEHKVVSNAQVMEKKDKSNNAKEYEANRKNKAEDRKRRAKLMNLEKEIGILQNEIEDLKILSASQDVVSDYVRLSEILDEISNKQNKLDELETQWLELS